MPAEFKFNVSFKSGSETGDVFTRIKRFALELVILIVFLLTLGGFLYWKMPFHSSNSPIVNEEGP